MSYQYNPNWTPEQNAAVKKAQETTESIYAATGKSASYDTAGTTLWDSPESPITDQETISRRVADPVYQYNPNWTPEQNTAVKKAQDITNALYKSTGKPASIDTKGTTVWYTPQQPIDVTGKETDAEYLKEQMHQKFAEQQRIKKLAEEAEAEKQRQAEKAANKGVSDPALTQGVTSPPSQGVNDPRLMSIINTLIAQKEQVQGTGDADIKEFEKQISDLKNQIAQAQEANETAKKEELNKKIEELNAEIAQAQASRETNIQDLKRQISDLKKPEQSGITQIPIKIIAIAGAALLGFILVVILILRGNRDSPSSS